MKKIVTIVLFMLSISGTFIYSQIIKQSNFGKADAALEDPKKVLIHLMGWYGVGNSGNHWVDGHAHNPIIGTYNSHSRSTLIYQMLLSWSCGIDGMVINVKDDYDAKTLEILVPTINMIHDIDSINFIYNFSISYDDQGMTDTIKAKTKFVYLRDNILPKTRSFLKYHDTAAIFIWNYNDPTPYLSAAQYDAALGFAFPANRPKVLWNQIDAGALGLVNSFYPWVGPSGVGWDSVRGLEWGHDYLAWYYPEINNYKTNLDFVCGGVWAGFNDTSCIWGKHRWMERKNGVIYDSTWYFVNSYSGILPLKWVYIDTWNDWNEGTEIEPSIEYGYQYLDSTIKNINVFKGTSVGKDTIKFNAAWKIYSASKSMEYNQPDSIVFYPVLKRAIKCFLLKNWTGAIYAADTVIFRIPVDNIKKYSFNSIEVYPDPAYDKLYIKLPLNNLLIQMVDIEGRILFSKKANKKLETINMSGFPKGIYLIRVSQNNNLFDQKLIIK